MEILFDGATNGIGAALAGTFVSLVLYGISVLQTYVNTIPLHRSSPYKPLLLTDSSTLFGGHCCSSIVSHAFSYNLHQILSHGQDLF